MQLSLKMRELLLAEERLLEAKNKELEDSGRTPKKPALEMKDTRLDFYYMGKELSGTIDCVDPAHAVTLFPRPVKKPPRNACLFFFGCGGPRR
jgi:hypothetical protein